MHYSIDFDNRKNYLFVHVRGKDSISNSLDYWARVRATCEQYGQHKILVVEELHDPPDEPGTYQVATAVPELFVDYPVKLAFVVPDRDSSEQDFGVEVSRKRGLNVKLFSRLDAAENWLQSD